MSALIHRMIVPLVFPQGICPGEQADGNHLFIAKDGEDRAVLRGSALAGALRHACINMQNMDPADVDRWFGYASDGDEEVDSALDSSKIGRSALVVPDCLLHTDQGLDKIDRTHNAVNRHTGAVIEGGLFSLEALPPGTRTAVMFILQTEKNEEDADPLSEGKYFLEDLAGLFVKGITLGGNAARGIGLAHLAGPVVWKTYDCADIEQQAQWLDEQYRYRSQNVLPDDGDKLDVEAVELTNELQIQIVLGIAPGEDVLVGDGQAVFNDYAMEPQRVIDADGVLRWRLPGSTLRGAVRGWMTRLAARAGMPVADHTRSMQEAQAIKGEDIAWGGMKGDKEKIQKALDKCENSEAVSNCLGEHVKCPIMRLFGSAFSKGRIHITDALSETAGPEQDEQLRAHVGIDRITGGANEGFFFQNSVLVGAVRFPFTITLNNPEEREVQWLYSALRAIDVGIIRIGSSKGSGRLALMLPPRAKGKFAEVFETYESEVK